MRDFRWRHVWLLLALILGQALFVLHAAQHPLAAAADYDCVVCGHGFDGQQALGAAAPAIPTIDPATISAPLPSSANQQFPAPTRPQIRGPPSILV